MADPNDPNAGGNALDIPQFIDMLAKLGHAQRTLNQQQDQSFIDPLSAIRAMQAPVGPMFAPGGTGKVHFMGGSPFPMQRPAGANQITSAALFRNIMGALQKVMAQRRQQQVPTTDPQGPMNVPMGGVPAGPTAADLAAATAAMGNRPVFGGM